MTLLQCVIYIFYSILFKCSSWPTQFGIKITNKIHLEREKIFLSDLTLPAHNNCVCIFVCVCERELTCGRVGAGSGSGWCCSAWRPVWGWSCTRPQWWSLCHEPSFHSLDMRCCSFTEIQQRAVRRSSFRAALQKPRKPPCSSSSSNPADWLDHDTLLSAPTGDTHTSCFKKTCTFFWIHSRVRASHKKIKKISQVRLIHFKVNVNAKTKDKARMHAVTACTVLFSFREQKPPEIC